MLFTNIHVQPGERVEFRSYGHGRRGGWVIVDDSHVTTDEYEVAVRLAAAFEMLAASLAPSVADGPITEAELRLLDGNR